MNLRIPTPFYRVPSLERVLGREFWIKREDALDDLGCGHKIRKLASLLPEIEAAGASVIITAGSLQSSQTTAVSLFAVRHGLKAHVIYMGNMQEKPRMLSGAYLACCIAGPELTWFPRRHWSEVDVALAEVSDWERARGEYPYVVPPGISEGNGLQGSVQLGQELAAQLPRRETHLVVATGSGGTALGIAAAGRAANLPWTVHAVCIATDAASTKARIANLAYQNRLEIMPEVTDITLGGGYGATGAELRALARRTAIDHGLVLDTTYMLKAYQAVFCLCEQGRIPLSALVVLVHTGGDIGVLCADSQLAIDTAENFPEWLSID